MFVTLLLLLFILSGLLDLLVALLPALPADSLQMILHVVTPQMLIVMTHHGAIRIRKAVVKVHLYFVTLAYNIISGLFFYISHTLFKD